MYRKNKPDTTTIQFNKSAEGETIERKVQRIVNNNEPIEDGAPLVFTERSEGVRPEHDIRTDRFELAVEAMDKITSSKLATREERIKKSKGEATADDTPKPE